MKFYDSKKIIEDFKNLFSKFVAVANEISVLHNSSSNHRNIIDSEETPGLDPGLIVKFNAPGNGKNVQKDFTDRPSNVIDELDRGISKINHEIDSKQKVDRGTISCADGGNVPHDTECSPNGINHKINSMQELNRSIFDCAGGVNMMDYSPHNINHENDSMQTMDHGSFINCAGGGNLTDFSQNDIIHENDSMQVVDHRSIINCAGGGNLMDYSPNGINHENDSMQNLDHGFIINCAGGRNVSRYMEYSPKCINQEKDSMKEPDRGSIFNCADGGNTMLRACCVPKCPNLKSHSSLHYLPRNDKLKKKWIEVLKLNKRKITSSFQVCGNHFEPTDFLPSISDQIHLKRGTVPSQNLPRSSVVTKVRIKRKPPKERHPVLDKNRDERNQTTMIVDGNDNIEGEESFLANNQENNGGSYILNDKTDDVKSAIEEMILNLSVAEDTEEQLSPDENTNFVAIETNTLKAYKDICIQVNTLDDFRLSDPGFMGMLRTDGDLNSFTGINSFDLLNRIVICMKSVKSIQSELEKFKIPIEVSIILVFTKIKTNLTFKQCGVLFKLHPYTISKLFSRLLPLLRAVLSVAVFWPTKDLNARNIPKCFEPDFVYCRAICDCSEVPIQKLKSINSRIKSFSHYKGKHTLKFQLTINPFGLITHTSSAYGGKASDKHIFLNEKILEKCEEGDAVMVDKGYPISAEVSAKGIDLIRPPILDQPQLPRDESILNTNIASARIHVERSNQRVKVFKIFQEKISVHMLRHMDDIIQLVCSVVNLSNPILSESRF